MTTPSLPASSAAASPAPSVNETIEAIDRFRDHGLKKDDIVTLSKLELAGVGRVLDMLQHEGRAGAEKLLGSIVGVQETNLRRLMCTWDTIGNEKGDTGQAGIDNSTGASTATPTRLGRLITTIPSFVTPSYLRPPSRTSRPRSNSTQSPRSPSSNGSSVTNPTNSSQNRVEKKKPVQMPRKQFHCPECKKVIRNGFEKHFRKDHLQDLIGSAASELEKYDVIGCGYCHAHGVAVEDSGKVFHGVDEFLRHVKDTHANNPHRLHWQISDEFNHILSAQPHFRRIILHFISQDRKNGHESDMLSLSWTPADRQHFKNLQHVSAKINHNPALQNDPSTVALLGRIYDAAAKKWSSYAQHLASLSDTSQPHYSNLPGPLQHSFQKSSQDLTGIGGSFSDTPTPSHHSVGHHSPGILSPAPHNPREQPLRLQTAPQQHPREVEMLDPDTPSQGAAPPSATETPIPTPVIAFPPFAPYTNPQPSDSVFDDIYKALYIDEQSLYEFSGSDIS